ncbi:MAG: amino acid permease, partial [Candidatus Eremiobacteraeota bacterium]|nr:amino acid permease [Candidatus Eremiobacteraeota bacterium]
MSVDETVAGEVTVLQPVAARDVHLVRGVTLAGAVAINAISMIGIGPLITIPLVLGALHGPLSLVGWVLGALIALCDGLVWSELGSLYPGSGGTYGYLLEIFGKARAGRLLAFLFVWQTIFVAPLNQATGYIGFANYAGYLFPKIGASPWGIKILAMCVGVATIIALYRGIKTISRIGLLLGAASLLTLLCVIVGSYVHFSPAQALTLPDHDSIWSGLRAGLGQALIIAMYDYLGYNQSSCIGGEVVNPAKTIPRSIIISIVLIAVLYITMQLGIIGAISWKSLIPLADGSLPPLGQHVASAIVEHSFGVTAAGIVTGLILITAFASVYGNLLGYSRVPYAAAADGVFLRPFGHIDPKHKFPDVSLVVMGLIALVACLFSLDLVINALTTGIVLI